MVLSRGRETSDYRVCLGGTEDGGGVGSRGEGEAGGGRAD